MADGFLKGRLYIEGACWDGDCAFYNGKQYVILPPLPAILIMPFIAIFGVDFAGFTILGVIIWGGIGLIWRRIIMTLTDDKDTLRLVLIAFLFATPLHYVALRADGLWFFAQLVGVLMVSGAFFFTLVRPNALIAGAFIGLAFLSRQLTLFLLPFLFVLHTPAKEYIFRINVQSIMRGLKLAAFPTLAVLSYLLFNYLRFGHALDTGYAHIFPLQGAEAGEVPEWLKDRVRDVGVFSPDYFLFNAAYMFFQGPHMEFTGPYLLDPGYVDDNGYGLLLGCPFLFFYFVAPWSRRYLAGALTIAGLLAVGLLYHSNGFQQHSVQRYVLDWLPIAFLFLPAAIDRTGKGLFALLAIYAMFLAVAFQAAAAFGQ